MCLCRALALHSEQGHVSSQVSTLRVRISAMPSRLPASLCCLTIACPNSSTGAGLSFGHARTFSLHSPAEVLCASPLQPAAKALFTPHYCVCLLRSSRRPAPAPACSRFSAASDPRTAKEEAKSRRLEAALLQPPGMPASLEEQVRVGAKRGMHACACGPTHACSCTLFGCNGEAIGGAGTCACVCALQGPEPRAISGPAT